MLRFIDYRFDYAMPSFRCRFRHADVFFFAAIDIMPLLSSLFR